MNRRTKFIAQVLFYGLGAGLLLYAASRTLAFVQNTMPADRQYLGYLYLLATGIGAVIWLYVFLTYAEGAKQRGIAFGMGILDLLAELVLVYADTVRVSAEKQMIAMTQDEMSIFIIASVIAVGLNIAAVYFFKLFDPTAEAASKARDLVDEVNDAAMKQLNTPAERQKMINDLSPILRASVLAEVTEQVYQMSGRLLGDNEFIDMSHTYNKNDVPDIVEAQPKEKSKRGGVSSGLWNAIRGKRKPVTTTYEKTAEAVDTDRDNSPRPVPADTYHKPPFDEEDTQADDLAPFPLEESE